MSESESAKDLYDEIARLEQAKRRWRAVALISFGLLLLMVVLGGMTGALLLSSINARYLDASASRRQAEEARMEAEEARMKAEVAHVQAEQARLEALRQAQDKAGPRGPEIPPPPGPRPQE